MNTGPLALFLDFDGTLVDIAATPDGIEVPPDLGARISALAQRFDGRLALVSGRSPEDLSHFLGGVTVAWAGSHGIARHLADGSLLGAQAEALPEAVGAALLAFAEEHGFLLETKPHGAALHYRHRAELEKAGIAFAEAIATSHDLQTKRGKSVIEIVRPGADKGGAVRAFMEIAPFAGAMPIFLGDDITDEDGFAAAEALGGFGVLVGDRASAAARFRLPAVPDVHDWLGL